MNLSLETVFLDECLTEWLSDSISEATDVQKVTVKGTGRPKSFSENDILLFEVRDLPLKTHYLKRNGYFVITFSLSHDVYVTRAITDVQIQIILFRLGISLKVR